MRIFIVAPLVRLIEVYAEYAEESTGETHGLDSIWRRGLSWHGGEVRLMRDRVEADSNPECGAILRSSALGVILEADAPLFLL
jgi:hypothetical protein